MNQLYPETHFISTNKPKPKDCMQGSFQVLREPACQIATCLSTRDVGHRRGKNENCWPNEATIMVWSRGKPLRKLLAGQQKPDHLETLLDTLAGHDSELKTWKAGYRTESCYLVQSAHDAQTCSSWSTRLRLGTLNQRSGCDQMIPQSFRGGDSDPGLIG